MAATKLSTRKAKPKGAEERKKESVIKQLTDLLECCGVRVRRERLPRGIGYKVASGQCRLRNDDTLVLDRGLPLQDQISFLSTHLATHGAEHSLDEQEALLPKAVRDYIKNVRSTSADSNGS